jgi:Translation initiation factor 2, gamma subunit (eIF-2gamma; GTPase)
MYSELLKYDTSFSEGMFITNIDNIFVQILSAIMHKRIEEVKHFVGDAIYNDLVKQVDYLENNNYIQFYDELNVKSTEILDVVETDNSFQIKVKITSRYMDYLMNSANIIIKGHDKFRIEKENYLVFEKQKKFKDLNEVRKCPGCGISMDINRNGKCEYCGTIFNLDERNWILVSFIME